MATVYCVVDFHARKQTVSYLTTESGERQQAGEIQQIELAHHLDQVRAFYARLRKLGRVVVGFESSGYAENGILDRFMSKLDPGRNKKHLSV